ncbi:sterol desaturase family protein [Candidatus Marimicrobium litorale]|uniref:Sterol desaturase family protein n=1 Tax=Candidatus Marimicrobium litorale TaxID=2518991 RepID=A0ABT3TB26_9GAMM|nr:sterol desaturase family protein [Candidatus Marimicrobium litorale]MCX2979040.1 sterol desaturase family protein [Candidatus Marimicrobium litorale]
MNYVVYAIPFFLLAILLELAFGLAKRRNTYRLNDSVSSLLLGTLSQARRFVTLGVGGYIYYLFTQHFSLPLMDASHWFTWVLAMVVYDFCYYWLHRMGHERSILWAAHVAHHQSEDYNLSTALRQTSTGFLLGWVFFIPMYVLGVPAEVVISVGSLNLIYQFWVHTEHIPKLGWYEWFFVTPSNHRVHHAQNDRYMDRNYGGLFILWDRLFGTFQEELDEEPVVFGIRGPLKSFNPLKALTHIYSDMLRDSWRTAHWRDKVKVWFARTGWRPEDVSVLYPRTKANLDRFQRYDPQVPRLVSLYAFYQLLALSAVLAYLQFNDLSYREGVAGWAILLATAATTAMWLEARSVARLMKWDLLRLGAILLLLVWPVGGVLEQGRLLAFAVYALVSFVFVGLIVHEPGARNPAPAS